MQRYAVFIRSMLVAVTIGACFLYGQAQSPDASRSPAALPALLPGNADQATLIINTGAAATNPGPAGIPGRPLLDPKAAPLPKASMPPGAAPTPAAGGTPLPPQLAQQAEPVQPAQPAPPTQPAPANQPTPPAPETPPSTPAARSVLSGLLGSVSSGTPNLQQNAPATQTNATTAAPASDVVSGGSDQALTRATTDAGDLLAKSPGAQAVQVQRRSPIITDPHIRGYYDGQLTVSANGAYFAPARADLDTVVSWIDSSNISDIVVIKGPYSVRYGPGFAFLDIETLKTPRFDCFEAHESSSLTYQTNGQQWHGRQAFWGGESDWGFRLGYDNMEGSDYETGAGLHMPSRYSQQDINFAYGFDFDPNTHFEFTGLRLRQRNVELPGTLTDINALVTDAYTARLTMDDQPLFDHMSLDAWYNDTHFNGDNLRPGKREQIPQLNNFLNDAASPIALFLETQADSISRGFREAMTWGKAKEWQFTAGVDLTYLSSYLDEYDLLQNLTSNQPAAFFDSPIPRAHLADPGIFIDSVLPVSDRLTLKAGARVDFASTQVEHLQQVPEGIAPPGAMLVTPASYELDLGPNAFSVRNFYLWSLYATSEYKVGDHWKLLAGGGYAEMPPTLTQLYADTPFLALNQNGFNFFVGNPSLSPPQDIQMDFGIRGEYERFRTGFSFYSAWIHDYITEELFDPTATLLAQEKGSATLLKGYRFMNTELASLIGGEYYTEWDPLDWLTPFGTLTYSEGTDLTRNGLDDTYTRETLSLSPPRLTPTTGGPPNKTRGGMNIPEEPLPGMLPIEAHVGFRLHQAGKTPRWGVEFLVRIVGDQDRYAASLGELPTPGFTTYNIHAYWQVNKHFLLTAGVDNFTNHNYRESLDLLTGNGVYQPGINFIFGSKLEF